AATRRRTSVPSDGIDGWLCPSRFAAVFALNPARLGTASVSERHARVVEPNSCGNHKRIPALSRVVDELVAEAITCVGNRRRAARRWYRFGALLEHRILCRLEAKGAMAPRFPSR